MECVRSLPKYIVFVFAVARLLDYQTKRMKRKKSRTHLTFECPVACEAIKLRAKIERLRQPTLHKLIGRIQTRIVYFSRYKHTNLLIYSFSHSNSFVLLFFHRSNKRTQTLFFYKKRVLNEAECVCMCASTELRKKNTLNCRNTSSAPKRRQEHRTSHINVTKQKQTFFSFVSVTIHDQCDTYVFDFWAIVLLCAERTARTHLRI